MQPTQLTAASFSGYPPEARALATSQLPLLREIPFPLLPILLRELIAYDWKLPAERRELNNQFTWLIGLTPAQRAKALESFRAIPLEPSLAELDWVNNPSAFMENLTAWLWSSQRMPAFRTMADDYTSAVNAAMPPAQPSMPRLGIVVVGSGAARPVSPLFRKLKPSGVHLTGIVPDGALPTLLEAASSRAASNSSGYEHWYIDGGSSLPAPHLIQVSYAALDQPRTTLLNRIQKAIATGSMGPEELRSLLTRMQPSDIGLATPPGQAALSHFQLSLLTEGAGAQIFATTFVQWAARECIRRAQPETILVRYAPRQQAQTMNAMLTGAPITGVDPAGSLVDADMGAYYTWLSLRRLPGAEQLRFLVWFEDHAEGVVIGPGLPAGTTSDSRMTMKQVLAVLA